MLETIGAGKMNSDAMDRELCLERSRASAIGVVGKELVAPSTCGV